MLCYTNNTDVELGWVGWGRLHGHPITHHTEEAFVGAGATLSTPLFLLSLHAPVPKQLRVCEGLEWNAEVILRKPASRTKRLSLLFPWPALLACSLSSPDPHFLRGFYLMKPNMSTNMDILVFFGFFFAFSSIEFNVVALKGRNSCLRGYRHLPRKYNKT